MYFMLKLIFILFLVIHNVTIFGSEEPSKNNDKPYHQHEITTADLNIYPQIINNNLPNNTEITIGDLHGNTQKLVYFLIKNNVVIISNNDYQDFIKIYKTPAELLSKEDIINFNKIINKFVFNTKYKLRFLGDDLADRGMNDYYTLKIFKALDEAFVKFEITPSNHNKFFLEAYERNQQSFDYNPYGPGRYENIVRSMLNLGKIISNNLIDKQEVLDIVKNNYLKHLVLPGITVNNKKNEITIYTHAPIDLNIIRNLAISLDLEYKDHDLAAITSSINAINSKIKSWIINRQLSSQYNELLNKHKIQNNPCPLEQILWNRNYSILNCVNHLENKPYTINYVHGHDSLPTMINLDNTFGKGDNNDKGSYAVYITST